MYSASHPFDAVALNRVADVLIRVGVNLQPGQRLLLAEPFELQGVSREASAFVDAVIAAAGRAGGGNVEVIWADEARLRGAAEHDGDEVFERGVAADIRRVQEQVDGGGALLFLQSSHPYLMAGLPDTHVARLRERCWRRYGPIAQNLVAAITNWSVAPAPTETWARAVFPGVQAEEALARLWSVVFAASRCTEADPIGAWRDHLTELRTWREDLNAARHRALRFRGDGTDLRVDLAKGHVWSDAQLQTSAGVAFVANFPTEEIFTAPDRSSATGKVRVARPVAYGGAVIDGIELEFSRGVVTRARASQGDALLRRVLQVDGGSSRLGEVALVRGRTPVAGIGAVFFHALLDENAMHHIALGDGYGFTVWPRGSDALNRSLIHLDLPVDAEVALA